MPAPTYGTRESHTVRGIEVFHNDEVFWLDVEVDYWFYPGEYETNCAAQVDIKSIAIPGVLDTDLLDEVREIIEQDLENQGWIYCELTDV